jgi:4'-phosphopantetheinyl transferase
VGEVHLWQASMLGEGDPSVLPPDEIARAERLRVSDVRRRFVRSRTLLRTVLGSYEERPPEGLRFASSGQGKPHLAAEGSVRFNLSRTDAAWMLAVARDRGVGVDVERLDRPVDPDALAARLFSRKECETLRGLAGENKARAFFRAWACREATVKAMGEGMFSHSDRFEVEADPERPVAAWPVDDEPFPWQLGVVPAPVGHVGVVAVEAEPSVIRNWQLG